MQDKDLNLLCYKLKAAFKEVGAENAFGDHVLVKLVREIQNRVEILETTDPCGACDGKGYVEHDCDCPHCTTSEVDCEECDGGRIPK